MAAHFRGFDIGGDVQRTASCRPLSWHQPQNCATAVTYAARVFLLRIVAAKNLEKMVAGLATRGGDDRRHRKPKPFIDLFDNAPKSNGLPSSG